MTEPRYGTHLIADLHLEREWLERQTVRDWQIWLAELAIHFDMRVLGTWGHDFGSAGAVTAGLILGTSHASVHTWPESGYVAVDLFSCNASAFDNRDHQIVFKSLPTIRRAVKIISRQMP